MRLHIESSTQISVNRSQIHPVIQRKQNARHNEITDEKPNHHHIIFETAKRIIARRHLPDRARNGDKRHARKRRPNHPKRHQPPLTFLVSDEKRLVVGVATCKIRDYQKPNKIGEYE